MNQPDGTVICDRCLQPLPAYGVIHGMVCNDLAGDGTVTALIFCYERGCAAAVRALRG